MKVAQGEIWFAECGIPAGHEQGGQRPTLIVSNDHYNNARYGRLLAVPLTTRHRDWPSHVELEPRSCGLKVSSWAMVEQVRAVSPVRCRFRIGTAPREKVDRVLELLHAMF